MEREEEEEATLTPTQLLQLAETHLRLRNFSLCRQYALESQHSNDPHRRHNHRRAAQIVSVADILLAASSVPGFINWYSVLQIDTFSDDHNLIQSQFKKLLLLLEPSKECFPLANEALDFVMKAYNLLSNPTKKSQLDSQLAILLSNQKHINNDGEDEGSFWTFCPYCFYVYQYARVYEGCCLRCQNETCRRAFHGVSLCSLPRRELDKGQYFSCFGYFPLGFSPPSELKEKGKFASWSPIVGLFPVRRIEKTCARRDRIDENGDEIDDENGDENCDDNDVQILDDSDESESPVYENENEHETRGENFGGNVGVNMRVPDTELNAAKPPMMRRKTVAWNAKKLMGRGKRTDEGANGSWGRSDSDGFGRDGDEDVVSGFDNMHDVAGGSGCGLDTADVKFFEEDGEIFVDLGPDDDAF